MNTNMEGSLIPIAFPFAVEGIVGHPNGGTLEKGRRRLRIRPALHQ